MRRCPTAYCAFRRPRREWLTDAQQRLAEARSALAGAVAAETALGEERRELQRALDASALERSRAQRQRDDALLKLDLLRRERLQSHSQGHQAEQKPWARLRQLAVLTSSYALPHSMRQYGMLTERVPSPHPPDRRDCVPQETKGGVLCSGFCRVRLWPQRPRVRGARALRP